MKAKSSIRKVAGAVLAVLAAGTLAACGANFNGSSQHLEPLAAAAAQINR